MKTQKGKHAKVDPKKVQIRDLNLKARQLRLRGGGRAMGGAVRKERIGAPTLIATPNFSATLQ